MPKGPSGQKRPADANKLARTIVQIATGEEEDPKAPPKGSAGGKVGGRKRAESLSAEERKAIAESAAKTRWKNTRG